jgi:hypothetical protein
MPSGFPAGYQIPILGGGVNGFVATTFAPDPDQSSDIDFPSGRPAFSISTDGQDWRVAQADTPKVERQAAEVNALTGYDHGFVAVGSSYSTSAGDENSQPACWTSADGTKWTYQPTGPSLSDALVAAFDGVINFDVDGATGVRMASFASEDCVWTRSMIGKPSELGPVRGARAATTSDEVVLLGEDPDPARGWVGVVSR